jgi:GrpB-like predicted nucleotidyltransferase (UPF0157 family)
MPKVEVTAYDPEWPRVFERIRALVWPAVQHAAMALEHVGSTAVPGLAAKPVVDACIVVASPRDIPHVVKALARIDYIHRGDLGVPGRESFRHPPSLPKHHLYASHRGSLSLKNHLGFRDHLRAHPAAVQEYGSLKEALAKRFPDDIDSYIAGKTDFILSILGKVGLTADELAAIRSINQVDAFARPDQA